MNKYQLFIKVAEAIHKLVNPSEDEIYRVIEGYLDGEYETMLQRVMKYYRVIHTKSSDIAGWCSEDNMSFAPNKRHHFQEISKYQFDFEVAKRLHKYQTVYERKRVNLMEENEALTKKVTKLEKEASNLKNIGWNLASDECCGCLGYMEVVTEIGTLKEKKLTWGELADTNTREYDPSGYPKI